MRHVRIAVCSARALAEVTAPASLRLTSKVKALIFQARTTLISRRQARDGACEAIREQLAAVRGCALRRAELRDHIDQCAGCHAFTAEVHRQRTTLRVRLPVMASLALTHNGAGVADV